jgi:hypothetical protein
MDATQSTRPLLVGVGGVAGKRVNPGLDRFALTVEIDIAAGSLAVSLDGPPGGAVGLVADEEDVVFGVVDALFANGRRSGRRCTCRCRPG